MIKAVPSRTIWRRPLMVRQPYSAAVPSTGGRFTSFLLRRKAWLEVELPLAKGRRRDSKDSFLNGKEGRDDFRKKRKIKTQYHYE